MVRPTRVDPKLVTILAAPIVPLLAACESGAPAVSLEEAKQITATFEGESFVPPPRTINDITAVLDEQKLADPEAAEKARAAARRPPPPGLSGVDLAEFYWKRGLAAGKIGDVKPLFPWQVRPRSSETKGRKGPHSPVSPDHRLCPKLPRGERLALA